MGLDMYLYGAIYKIDGETCSTEIKLEEIAYWSKHNAIHNWFVKNVQEGVDNRAMYCVTEDCLKKLLEENLKDDYELEYYLDGLKYTVKMIKEVLKDGKYEYYYYHASW